MAKETKDEVVVEPAPEEVSKTEDQDHADNEAMAEKPVAVEGRRDGNGALIV